MSAFLAIGACPFWPSWLRRGETRQKVAPRGQTGGECEDFEARFPTRAVWHLTKPQLRGGANVTPYFPTPQTARTHPHFGDEREDFVAFRHCLLAGARWVRSRRPRDDDANPSDVGFYLPFVLLSSTRSGPDDRGAPAAVGGMQ